MKIRILLIDDFPLTRAGMAAALIRDPAMEVVGQAGTGAEGLRLAAELQPDVILLDMHLPDMGGMIVLDEMRAHAPNARVLMVTASESPENVVGAVAAGAAGYLTKRSDRAELCSAVITVHGGGAVIAPSLAGHLVQRYAAAARQGDPSALRTTLTARENEILRLVADGMTDREIASTIYVSPRTVQNHLARIRDKTGLARRSELTRWAVQHAVV